MTRRFSPAITDVDGTGLQPLTPDDAPLVAQLINMRANRFVVDLPTDTATIATAISTLLSQPWSMPLAVTRGNECIGVVATAFSDTKALHASLVPLFVDPPSATLALAMGLRHLFWTFPLRRLHTQIPDTDMTREYIELLESAGFQVEGRLVDHAIIAGQPFDTVALGLLRSDFETWCAHNEPHLALTTGSST